MTYKIKNRIWIEGDNGTYLAEGRIVLLKEIIESGSITSAAKSMKMSYKKAWDIIDGMNREASEPLVERVSGGKGGGGTVVTKKGEEVIKKFEKLNSNCRKYLEEQLLMIDL